VQPEQPDTPATEPVTAPEPPGAATAPLPVARPVRSPRDPIDRAERAARRAREAARVRRLVRATLVAMAVALTGVFVAAFRINPYNPDGTPRTMSTHTQLGMPPCNFVTLTGKPCPSCGMTTSFALLVRGDVVSSARANWVGSVICVLWAFTLVWATASGLWGGKPLFVPPGRGEMVFTVIVGAVLVLMLARWTAVLISG
jgi:hypothetical protein